MTSEAAALTEQITGLPTEPGSVIEAKPPGRKKAFLMALCDDGEWWVRLDNYGSFSERGPFREVRILFDAGAARLADSRPVVSEAAVEAAAEALRLVGVHSTNYGFWSDAEFQQKCAETALTAALPHMGDGRNEA